MYRTLRSGTGMGTLVLGSLLGVGTSPVQAQTYIAPAPRYAAPTYVAPADTSVAQGDYDFYTQALHGG